MSLLNKIINDLKQKYESENSYKTKVINTVQEIIKCKITHDEISVSDGVLYIKTNPTVKSAILLKNEKVVEKLKELGLKIYTIK